MAYRLLNPYSVSFICIGLFSFVLAAVAYRRSQRGGTILAVFMVGVAIWSVADAIRIGAPTRQAVIFWNKVSYVGIVIVFPSFVTFVLTVTNRERWLKRRYVGSLVGIAAVALLLAILNPWGLWRAGEIIRPQGQVPVLIERRGIAWYVWATIVYSVLPILLYILLREMLQEARSRQYRDQLALIAAGMFVSALTTGAFVFGFVEVDPSPFGFAVMGLLFAVALVRYRLFDITPIARDVVFDAINSGVIVVDSEQTIVDLNEHAREVVDIDDPIGRPISAIVPEDSDLDERFEGVSDTVETISVETPEGTRHYRVTISAIDDPLGSSQGRAFIFSENTEQVERQRRLEERTERLKRQNERLDQFASLVSHDLRNPLQVVGSSLDLYRQDGNESHLDRAERAVERMEDIVDDLLLLAHLGTDTLETASVDLEAVVTEAAGHVEGGCSVTVADSLPVVEGDRDRLLHVFENLFRNAVEHGLPDDRAGPIEVTVGPLPDGEGFYVADDGVGIPESEREEVFEHGYTTDPEGTGFGLSIVREVVEVHGWSIDVTDSESGGTRFEIRTAT